MYQHFAKPLLSRLISTVALIILSPLFLILAILIKTTSKGPVFFRQDRITKNKKIFKIHKFRTMYTTAPKDVPTHLLKNPDAAITKIGKILRKTSLDELPQLIDVLTGKMALVGPRPALFNQDDLIKERDKYGANDILPGITGWAQINGRDELPIKQKAKLDGDYTKKITFINDLKILLLTVVKVFKSDGIVEGTENHTLRP